MVNENEVVPDVKLEAPDGRTISPADFRGNKLVLYFYPKDDTSGCTAEAQAFSRLADDFEAFGTWIEKSMYGRKYMGIDRATFLIDRDGVVKRVWRKVKVPGHAEEVLAAARELP
jgi:thioredoxin-dependent peroxiredoxin